jgi:hypothetical protein
MVAPTLTDYSYQYKDTGVLLNADSASFPFWDVTKIQGIADFPELDVDFLDLDGQNGSFVTGNFFKNRTIIAEGSLYCAPADVETNNELLKATILPDGIDYPFYWKHPNKTQRYFMGKPIGYSADVDTGRRTGIMAFQVQIACTDPRSYINIAPVSWTAGTNYTWTNAGNTSSDQIISITAGSTTTANITVANITTGLSFQFLYAITSGHVLTIDVEKLIIRDGGVPVNVNLALTGGAWPISLPGLNTWKVTSNIGNGNSTPTSAWL